MGSSTQQLSVPKVERGGSAAGREAEGRCDSPIARGGGRKARQVSWQGKGSGRGGQRGWSEGFLGRDKRRPFRAGTSILMVLSFLSRSRCVLLGKSVSTATGREGFGSFSRGRFCGPDVRSAAAGRVPDTNQQTDSDEGAHHERPLLCHEEAPRSIQIARKEGGKMERRHPPGGAGRGKGRCFFPLRCRFGLHNRVSYRSKYWLAFSESSANHSQGALRSSAVSSRSWVRGEIPQKRREIVHDQLNGK